MADIFISYTREDRARVDPLVRALRNQGWSVWWDQDILPGVHWDRAIDLELINTRCIVVVWTPRSLSSDEVRTEATEGRGRRCLIQVTMDGASWPKTFGGVQAVDLTTWAGDSADAVFLRLCGGIRRIITSQDPNPLIDSTVGRADPSQLESRRPANAIRPPHEPEMVPLSVGCFVMGASEIELRRFKELGKARAQWESPRHTVLITRPFAIGRFPVTFDQWGFAEAEGACRKADDCRWGKGRRPVINISWEDVQGYLAWLQHKTSKPYRLPSESEWEYACRAGSSTAFHFTDFIPCDSGNFIGKELDTTKRWRSKARTVEVDACRENAFGLRGMHGNVWEWVQDTWHDSYIGAPANQEPWLSGGDDDFRVIRGGSWKTIAKHVRSATRGKAPVATCADNIGFRVALDV